MITLRWIIFIPSAFLASIVAGALFKIGVELLGGPLWITWIISGLFSGVVFAIVGAAVAPFRTKMVKWVLALLIILLGILSTLGGFLRKAEQVRAFAGAGMVLIGIGFAKTPIENWGKEPDTTTSKTAAKD